MTKQVFLTLLILLSTTPACSRKTGHRIAADLIIPLGGDPSTLDPQVADTGIDITVLKQVTSTLFEVDEHGLPQLSDASKFYWEMEGHKLRVLVRADRTWSDGQALKACQFRDAIVRALDPKTPSHLADVLFDINGASEFKNAKIPVSSLGITCNDARNELEIETTQASSSKLLYALAFPISAPLRLTDIDTPPSHRATSGAYRVESWERNQRLILVANSPQTSLKKIAFVIVRDPTTALTMYNIGDLDILPEVPPAMIEKLKGRQDVVSADSPTTYMVGFNQSANPSLKDPRVRRALVAASGLAEVPQLLGGGEREARGWIPPILLSPEATPSQSLDQVLEAQKLFTEAGFSKGKAFPKLPLLYNSGERHQMLMERLANNWKRNLGIDVSLEPMEWKAMVAQLKSKTPALYRYAWTAVYPDPLFFLELFLSDSPNNFAHWSNAHYDTLVRGLQKTAIENRDSRFWKDVQEANRILVWDDPALIPIFHYRNTVLVKPEIQGFGLTLTGFTPLKNVSRKERASK